MQEKDSLVSMYDSSCHLGDSIFVIVRTKSWSFGCSCRAKSGHGDPFQ